MRSVELLGGGEYKEDQEVLERATELLDMTTGEVRMFRAKVELVGGHVPMFVHPLYEMRNAYNAHEDEGLESRIQEVEDAFYREVCIAQRNARPLVVFEEGHRIADTKMYLQNVLGGEASEVVFVPTESATGNPLRSQATATQENEALHQLGTLEQAEVVEANWQNLRTVFASLGVRSAAVSGMYLFNDASFRLPDDPNGEYLDGCTAQVVDELRKQFDVTYTEFTNPYVAREALEQPFSQ